ncbi:MAG: M3 family metallopeptidase [Alphaproteobacteria bacterium]|nr:M3 family metallopeptidase [Alphaproteobacteria bacterium]
MNSLWTNLPAHLRDNPFFHFSAKTNFVPAWDKITPAHALPAMEYIFDNMRREIEAIAQNPAKPNYKNTVEALEKAYSLPMHFFLSVFTTMPKDEEEQKQYDDVEQIMCDKFHELYMDVFQNKTLFNRFLFLTITPEIMRLTGEREKLYGMYAQTFKACGIMKKPAQQQALRDMGRQISTLARISQKNMRESEKAAFIRVSNPARLAGLSDVLIGAAAAEAKKRGFEGEWCFGVGTSTYGPFMKSVQDRDLRREMWILNSRTGTTGEFDNRRTILKLIKLEHEMARMEGYRNPAAHSLQYNMARTSKRVESFLRTVRKAAKPVATEEIAVLKAFAAQEDQIKHLKPWDLDYYKERLKKRVLGFDEEQLRPYFEMEAVLQGVFRHFNKLFGLKFTESTAYPKYDPDVRTFNVTNARTGKHMGVLCMDLFDRSGKPAGTAWNISAVSQGLFEGENRRPVDMVVTKFIKGQDGQPTLLTHYDLEVLLHEMGHATHNLLGQCRYQSFSGTSVDTDFVEFPSQIQESWAYLPEVLDDIARHHETGEKIPDHIKKKMKEGRKFMAGSYVMNYAMKGWLDLAWYRKDPSNTRSIEAFERHVTRDFMIGNMERPLVSPRFHHIFGGGYEAGFYSYQWSEMMSAQLFEKFEKHGAYNRSLSASFKKALAVGGSREEADTFYTLTGRHPRIQPLLRQYGLLGKQFNYAAAFKPQVAVNDNRQDVSLPKPAKLHIS